MLQRFLSWGNLSRRQMKQFPSLVPSAFLAFEVCLTAGTTSAFVELGVVNGLLGS